MSDIPEFHGNPNDRDYNPEYMLELKAKIDELQKERAGWIKATSEMESKINELEAGEDWYKNRLAELSNDS